MHQLMFILLSSIAIILTLLLLIIPIRKNKLFATFISIMMISGIITGYIFWGSGSAWLQFESQKHRQTEVKTLLKTMKGTDAIIAKLKEKVKQNPDNPQGWYLLGRLYASQKAWPLAVASFKKAHILNTDDVATTVNYGQALWQNNNRQFNADIRMLFQQLLKKDPDQPDALAMMAMDYHAQGKLLKAIEIWEQLLTLTNPQSQEAAAIREAIAAASQKMQLTVNQNN